MATAGLATPLIAGVAVTVGEFAVNAVVGGALTGMAERAGEALGSKSMGPASGAVSQGSPNVLVNGLPAARVGDAESCHGGQVAQGSTGVFINGRPAARVGDKTTCGAVIVGGSANVFIGGGVTTRLPIQSEVPQWVRWAAVVVGLLPALGGAARALGSALAEVAETGLARAAQTGVKALGRAMEERAGGAPLSVPMSRAKFDEIRAKPNGLRAPPETYLPPSYIDQHLSQFDNGGSYLVRTKTLNDYGRDPLGRLDGQYIMPKSQMDDLIARTGGDTGKIESELGIPAGSWDKPGESLSRIDIDDPRSLGLRMPSGNEVGANTLWMPGGKLPGAGSEAVVNQIPTGSYTETIVRPTQ